MTEKKIIFQFEEHPKGNQYSYIYLKEQHDNGKAGDSKRQVIYDGFDSGEAKEEKIELILDFDKNNKLIGIEIISSRDIIPDNLKE